MSRRLTADHIAWALTRAAKHFGENAELIAIGACPSSRAGWHALCAIEAMYGPRPALAEMWGVGADRHRAYKYVAGQPVDRWLIDELAYGVSLHPARP